MTPAEVREVQLSILDRFMERCAAEGIEFFAYMGTLLGALRHEGYVPWDDDIDLGLMRHHYERVRSVDWSTSGLELIVPGRAGYPMPFLKLADPRTRVREDVREPWGDWGGVNIDLWPLDYVPRTRVGEAARALAVGTRNAVHHAHTLRDDPTRPPLKRAILAVSSPVLGRLSLTAVNVRLDDRLARTPRGGWVERYYGTKWHFRQVPVDAISPVGWASFEGRRIPVPRLDAEVLTTLFGDWRTPPPPQRRVRHHAYHGYWLTEHRP